jgi:phosphoglycerate kinase
MVEFLTPAVARRYHGTTCLLRVDLNVEPGAEDATNRVDAVIPTIRLLLKHTIRVVLCSHRGRPTRRTPLSLLPFVRIVTKKLGTPVRFIPGTNLSAMRARIGSAKERVVLMENLRFFSGEAVNDVSFARHLAALGDFYVNDAFAVAHRTHASTVAITKFLPSYGGLRLKEELARLDEAMKRPKHPFVVVVGGAKVGDKLRSLHGLLKKADAVLLGSSVFNEEDIPNLPKLSFPDDIKAHGDLAWDIGPWTVGRYAEALTGAKAVIWNGPVGFYEKKGFTDGTRAVWRALLRNRRARGVVGGGETVASLKQLRIAKRIPKNIFISTGGGAMLAYLAGEKLSGVEALK